jgi:cell division protein FtsW (lipid II flippase)
MFLLFGVIAIAFLFYKWAISNNDYFEKRGVAFLKPAFLLGSSSHVFYSKISLPEILKKWYSDSLMKNEK